MGQRWFSPGFEKRDEISILVPIELLCDQLEQVFEKFYQVGYATSGVREWTGLGLAICKRLVEMHGGSIGIDSEPGSGSRFYCTVPKVM